MCTCIKFSLRFQIPSPKKLKDQQTSTKAPSQTGKAWHCPKCPFVSGVKSHIVAHMQSHSMEPFHCTACGMKFKFRSSLYRHILNKHNTSDYAKYAKVKLICNWKGPSCFRSRLRQSCGSVGATPPTRAVSSAYA